MTMTKKEVLAAIRNHESEIKHSMITLDSSINSLVEGYREEIPGEIESMKSLMDFVRAKTDEIKQVLSQWPEPDV